MKSFRQYINEVKEADIEAHELQRKIDDAGEGDFSSYAFNNIFGNKLRIVIPMDDKGGIPLSDNQVRAALEREGFGDIDFEKGTLTKSTETRQGPKTQKLALGRVLKRLSKNDPAWQHILHWWEMKADKTKEMGDATGVSIIISRSPIDIIRMSDHKEWRSCHAPPGKPGHISSYWPCAGQEARTGGAIAYVVRNSDLQTLDDLQAPEIFKDNDRDVEGVEPLERLRLRRFTTIENGKTLDILVPEDSVYGIRHVGFAEKVMGWARKVQASRLNFDKPPDWKHVQLRGGTYQDTDADTLWNAFFPKAQVHGSKTSIDNKEQDEFGGPTADSMYERAEEQVNAREFKHTHVTFDVGEDDQPYLYYDGFTTFSYPQDDFTKIPQEDDLRITWSYRREKGSPTLGDMIKDKLDISFGDNEVHVHADGQQVHFSVPLNTEDEGYGNYNDRLESFLDWIERDIEGGYDAHWGVLRRVLIDAGYLKNNWQWGKLKHFRIEEGDRQWKYEAWAESDELWIGDLRGVDSKNVSYDEEHLTFPNHKHLLQNIHDIFPKFKFLTPGSIRLTTKPSMSRYSRLAEGPITSLIYVFLQIHAPVVASEYQKFYATLKHIDDYWAQYDKRAEKWWSIAKSQLMGQQAGAMQLPKVAKKPKVVPQRQLELPFKDWLIMSELPMLLEQRKIIPVQNADQKYDYDCGPAALRAIAKLFGHSKTQEELIDMADTGKRKGTHPEGLIKAAKKLGMKVEAKKNMTLETLLGHIKKGRPVICAIQAWADKGDKDEYKDLKHGHYVVAMGYSPKQKIIYFEDPSMHNGKRGKLKFDEFMRRWYDKESYLKSSKALQPHLGIVVWDYPQKSPYHKRSAQRIP